MTSTYVAINPNNTSNRQDALVVIGAVGKVICDTSSSNTYNYICKNLRDDALDTDGDWQIARWPKVSPFTKQWGVVSVTNKATSAYVFKASDRTNLNFG